ncbi:hypothetical protein BN7_5467 [Wickerhamomyces ciferrii]|uniref:Uncharacterized protein n=1 Tax=Wickerhamomyces ciferrii (strain ATCC 14091 / BCRC 22168 / CBS 111 / JCM 3599 / NBRC 0793 / NRRL Y-1031 F-60-10) TaxID=1206466 RepID=K0KKY2_WICCF|nr:uncharacterized protein BN7_5467 [Wickerhamomyces ciferrii]CCH45880.1 hypothetical protein BN7_5467 [Wickerhamomyces ciferrii]
MKPSIRCARHHCRTIYNPVTYNLQRSYNSLPFKPKALFYPHSSNNIQRVSHELQILKDIDPSIQVVTASIDMKYKDAIGEAWFDKPININSYRRYKDVESEISTAFDHFRMVIHKKKIDLSFIHMFLEEQIVNMYVKEPHGEFGNLLTQLEVELPFDENETTYTSKSQYKAISGKLKVNEISEEDYLIKKLSGFNAGALFEKLKDKTELMGKDYKYLLEVNENGKRNRVRVHDEHFGEEDLGILIDSPPPAVGTNCQLYQLCMDDLYTPVIFNGLLIEKYHKKNHKHFLRDDVIVENVLNLGATSGFMVDDRQYIGFGDHVKIEAIDQ